MLDPKITSCSMCNHCDDDNENDCKLMDPKDAAALTTFGAQFAACPLRKEEADGNNTTK
jgi:hypothetical protein